MFYHTKIKSILWTNYLRKMYIYSFVLKRILKDINSFCFYFYLRKFFLYLFKFHVLKRYVPDPRHPVTFDFWWQHVTTCDISNHWEIVYMYILKLPKLGIILCSAILTKYSFDLLYDPQVPRWGHSHTAGVFILWIVIYNKDVFFLQKWFLFSLSF